MKLLLYSIIFTVLLSAVRMQASAQTNFTLQYPTSSVTLYTCGAQTGPEPGVVQVTLRIENASDVALTNQQYTLGFNSLYTGLYFNAAASLPSGVTWTGPAGAGVQDGDKARVITASVPANSFKEITLYVRVGCDVYFPQNETQIDLTNPLILSGPSGSITFSSGSNKTYRIRQTGYLTYNPALYSETRNGDLVVRKYVLTNLSQKSFTGVVHFSDLEMTDQLTIQSVRLYDEDHSITPATQAPVLPVVPVTNAIITSTGVTQQITLAHNHWLIIEEIIKVTGCVDLDKGKSKPNIEWGCFTYDYLPEVEIVANITVPINPPVLTLSHSDINISTNISCLGQGAVTNRCSWVNTSTTTARNVRVLMQPREPVVVPVGAVRVYIKRANGSVEGPYDVNYLANNITPDYMSVSGISKGYTRAELAAVMPGYNSLNASDMATIINDNSGKIDANLIAHYVAFNGAIYNERNNYANYNYFESARSYEKNQNAHPSGSPYGKDILSEILPQALVEGQGSDVRDVFFIRQLVINKIKTAGNQNIDEIVLNPNDILTVEWDEYSLCMYEGIPGDRMIIPPTFLIDFRNECKNYSKGESFIGVQTINPLTNSTYALINTGITASLTAGTNFTEGDPDRCVLSADGMVETISFDLTAREFQSSDITPTGSLELKLYLQDGLDLDRSLAQPFAWGRTDNFGFNNINNDPSGCLGQCATCENSTNVVPATNKYRVRLTLRNKSLFIDVPASSISVISDDDESDAIGAITYNDINLSSYNMIQKPATFLYTIRIDIASIMSLLPNATYEELRRQLDGANLSFDVRAYCPSDKHIGKSGWRVNSSWVRCNPYPTTSCDSRIFYENTPSAITVRSQNAISLFTIGSEIMVNCPGCKIPGTELLNYKLIRTNVGLVDEDENGEPDINAALIPASHPNRRIMTHGDTMQVSFMAKMPDGSEAILYGQRVGCTKAELDSMNYLLDNLYINFVDASSTISLVPGTIEVALFVNDQTPVWKVVPLQDIITTGGRLMIRVRASLLEAEERINNSVIDNEYVNVFHTHHAILVRASFQVFQVRGIAENVEFNYSAGFSACDDCETFGRVYEDNIVPGATEMIDMNPASRNKTLVAGIDENGNAYSGEVAIFNLTDLNEVGDNAYFWCTNGGNVFRFVPYDQSTDVEFVDSKESSFSCVKEYRVISKGKFYETGPGVLNHDAFPKEYRRFFGLNSEIKHDIQLPAGYEVFEIKVEYYHRQGNKYDEYRVASILDQPTILGMITDVVPTNSLLDRNIEVVFHLEADEDNLVANLVSTQKDPAFRANYNDIVKAPEVFTFPIDEENYEYTLRIFLRPTNCTNLSVINLTENWGSLFVPLSSIPYKYGPLGNNPNALKDINTRPLQNVFSFIDPAYNYPVTLITPPAATLLAVSQETTSLRTGEQYIQVPIRIDCGNEGNASFPYFRVQGPALQKGVRLVGVYKGNKNLSGEDILPALYTHYLIDNGSLTDHQYIAGIDRDGALKILNNSSHYYIDKGSNNYYTLVFAYECGDCNPYVRCDMDAPLNVSCLSNDEIFIDYGWNCNAYPNFETIEEVCHSYDALEYKITTSKAGLSADLFINNIPYISETVVGSCENFIYKTDLTSCREGQVDNFEVRFELPPGVSLASNANAVLSNTNLFDLTLLTDGTTGYRITSKSPATGLPHVISENDRLTKIILSVPLFVNCSFDAGTIITKVNAKTYCDINIETITKSVEIKTEYDDSQLDDISLSQINVTADRQSVQIVYNIPSASITRNNYIRVTLPDQFVVAGSSPTQRVITLDIPASGTGVETISLAPFGDITCNGSYDVMLELLGSYEASCPATPQTTCTKTVAYEEAIYPITIAPFTVTTNEVDRCILSGVTALTTSISGGNASASYTYKWYNNGTLINAATSAAYSPIENGTYSVEVSDGICTVTETWDPLFMMPLIFEIGPLNAQATFLCGHIDLVARVRSGTTPYVGTWTQIATPANIVTPASFTDDVTNGISHQKTLHTVTQAAVYEFKVTDANGCSSARVFSAEDHLEILPPAPICPGQSPSLVITNMGSILGTYDNAGWFDESLPTGSQDLITEITHEGYYSAAVIIPGCTLRTTQPYHIQFKSAPAPFTLTPDGYIFACADEQHTVSIINKAVNDRNNNGNYYDDNILYYWTNGNTTLNDQIFVGANNLGISAMDMTSGCVTNSNGPIVDNPCLKIAHSCTGTAGQIKLTASANFPDGTYEWWIQNETTGAKTLITTGISGVNNRDLIVTQPGIYVVSINHATCGKIEALFYESMVVSAAPNADLLDDLNGRFEGLTTCSDPKLFTSDLGCVDRSYYTVGNPNYINPANYGTALPGNYMISYGTNLNANSWNPGYWQGTGYNSNGFMIVDGTPVLAPKVVWSMDNVPVTMGHFHLFRAMVRNITTTDPPVPQERPQVELRITYYDASGNSTATYTESRKILFSNTNQQWVELSDFTPSDAHVSSTGMRIVVKAKIELVVGAGTALGRDFAIDNISFIPVGLCDNLQEILDVTGRNCGSVASVDFYQKTTCGEPVTFNVFDLATDPGITYSWRNATTNATIGTGKVLTVTPTATTNYILKVENVSKGCFFEQEVRAIVLPGLIGLTADDKVLCAGGTVQLVASGADSYVWSPATGLSNANIANPVVSGITANTAYTVTGFSSNGCSATKIVNVTYQPLPAVTITPNSAGLCVGTPLEFTASGADSYVWATRSDLVPNGATATLTLVSNPGGNPYNAIIVTGTTNGCSNTVHASVSKKELPLVTLSDATICSGGNGDFNVQGSASYNYVWTGNPGLSSFSVRNPIVLGSYPRSYTLTVTDPATNCSVVRTAIVNVEYNCGSFAPNYDGVNDRTTIPYMPVYNRGSQEFTVEAWVKLSATQSSEYPMILASRTAHGNGFIWCIDGTSEFYGRRMIFQILGFNYHSHVMPSTLYDNQCHHLAVVRTSTGVLTFYIDGAEQRVHTGISGSINSPNTIMTIGTETNGTQPFKGSISEVRFWNTARTATEIANNRYSLFSATNTSLIGYWKFKQLNTQVVVDESATRNNGYYGNSVSNTTFDPSYNGTFCGGPTLTSVAPATSVVCGGQTLTVNYTALGFAPGTTFHVFVSNASGVYPQGTPYVITGGAPGGSFTVATSTTPGTGYLIKMRAADGTSEVISAPFTITNQCTGLLYNGGKVSVVPSHNSYNLGTGNFTFEAWVNFDAVQTTTYPMILSRRTHNLEGFLWALVTNSTYTSSTEMVLQVDGYNTYSGNLGVELLGTGCHHVAVRRIGDQAKFYVDGVEKATGTINTSNPNTITCSAPLLIGADYGSGQTSFSVRGRMHEIRFWNYSRPNVDIQSGMNAAFNSSTANLIGYWRFNEASGQTIIDNSSTANNGVLGTTSAAQTSDPVRGAISCFANDRLADGDHGFDEALTDGPQITYFPNPFDKVLTVLVQDASTEDTNASLHIYNANGVEVYKGSIELNVQNELHLDLPAGIYLAVVRYNDNTMHQHKIIRIQ